MLTVFVYPIFPVLLRKASSFISCEFLPLNLIIAIKRKIKDTNENNIKKEIEKNIYIHTF